MQVGCELLNLTRAAPRKHIHARAADERRRACSQRYAPSWSALAVAIGLRVSCMQLLSVVTGWTGIHMDTTWWPCSPASR
jgi:hypothetical protein